MHLGVCFAGVKAHFFEIAKDKIAAPPPEIISGEEAPICKRDEAPDSGIHD